MKPKITAAEQINVFFLKFLEELKMNHHLFITGRSMGSLLSFSRTVRTCDIKHTIIKATELKNIKLNR